MEGRNGFIQHVIRGKITENRYEVLNLLSAWNNKLNMPYKLQVDYDS
jgi:hypothetical protein